MQNAREIARPNRNDFHAQAIQAPLEVPHSRAFPVSEAARGETASKAEESVKM